MEQFVCSNFKFVIICKIVINIFPGKLNGISSKETYMASLKPSNFGGLMRVSERDLLELDQNCLQIVVFSVYV